MIVTLPGSTDQLQLEEREIPNVTTRRKMQCCKRKTIFVWHGVNDKHGQNARRWIVNTIVGIQLEVAYSDCGCEWCNLEVVGLHAFTKVVTLFFLLFFFFVWKSDV